MKKVICCLLMFAFVLCAVTEICAYSTSEYSIDLPKTYKEVGVNSFTKDDGTNVNLQITGGKGDVAVDFSEKELDKLVKEINTNFDSYKDEVKEQLKKQYGSSVTEEQIEQALNTLKWNIEEKEVTTATKNKYKCYHIISKVSAVDRSYYADQYSFISGNTSYTLTASVSNKEDLQSQEIKDIINSFTIANYKEPKKSKSSNIMQRYLIVFVCAAVGGILGAINRKRVKKAEETKAETTNTEEQSKETNKNE